MGVYVHRIEAQDGTLLSQQEARNFFVLSQDSVMAATQIEIQIPITIVQEETTFPCKAYFRTRESKQAATPTTVHYRIDCLTTGKQVRDWTSVSSFDKTANLVITSSDNQILGDGNRLERKQITVKVDTGLVTQLIKSKHWQVQNLVGIT
jgi:hypothetical protein